jgi:1,4-alpha-glucan branching enzyme
MLEEKIYKTKDYNQITFTLSEGLVEKFGDSIETVHLVGEFNDWDPTATPLKESKGEWKVNLKLDKGKEFQYRFLINGTEWENDWEAHKYVSGNAGEDNSVVVVSE